MNDTVKYEVHEDIAVVTMNNPPVNAMTQPLADDLHQTLDELKRQKLRAVILTGTGKYFQAGADINVFLKVKTEEDGMELATSSHKLIDKIPAIECPVIAAINGVALGGGTEISLACDIRIASTAATFGLTEVSYGVIPGGGGTQRMPRLIGPGRAKMLIYSGKRIKAEEAFNLGLVDMVVEPDQLLPEAMNLARMIAEKSPAAVKTAKRAINEGLDVSLAEGLSIERNYLAKLCALGDMDEGATAFFEKRKPKFTVKNLNF